jgi:hypothetical protein
MVAAILLGSASEMTDTEYVLMSFMVEGIGLLSRSGYFEIVFSSGVRRSVLTPTLLLSLSQLTKPFAL